MASDLEIVELGVIPDGTGGDTPRAAWEKVNRNTVKIGDALGSVGTIVEEVEQLKTEIEQEVAQAIATVDNKIDELETSIPPMVDAAIAGRIPGKNLLINGDFRIWQRGTNFTAPGYTSDRWTFNFGGVASGNVWRNTVSPGQFPGVYADALARVSYGAITNSAAHFVVFEQHIEGCDTAAGQTVAVSFWVYNSGAAGRQIALEFRQGFGSGGSAVVDSIGSKKFALPAGMSRVTHSVTIPSVAGKQRGANDSLAFTIWCSAGSQWNARSDSLGAQVGDVHFTEVQVEVGGTATGFERRHPALELVLCQRYYEKSYNLGSEPGSSGYQGREAHSSSGVQGATNWATVRFSQRKRTAPAVVIYPAIPAGGSPGNVGQNDSTITTAAIENIGSGGIQVAWGNSAGKFGAWFHWTADAEI